MKRVIPPMLIHLSSQKTVGLHHHQRVGCFHGEEEVVVIMFPVLIWRRRRRRRREGEEG